MKTRFQKTGESLQEYASEVERLANLAFSDHPATVRETIYLQYFVGGLKDEESRGNRKRSADENEDVRSKRHCSESSKNLSNSLRIEKKFGVIDPVVRQVTTPSTSEFDPWSDDSVRKEQLADPEIKPIREFKESSDKKPSWQVITPFHPTTKRYWALWDSLHLRNGVLYRKWD
ncbi:integrase_H2C2 domain-containing protein [Trichonephila clavipes]|nr:integrase_H2C2 domain-containing protein [Trichonephila clavipes]